MQATIDRIDEGIAVLITCGEKPARIMVPVQLLPQGGREGDIVSISILPDPEETAAAKDRISRMAGRLRDK